jgi:hypothetical protein
MKIRTWKQFFIVLIIEIVVLGLLGSALSSHTQVHANTGLVQDLDKWYAGSNSAYFEDKLPKNTIIDWNETDSRNMAVTYEDGEQFHISLNPYYVRASRTAWEVILHEQCHIEEYKEAEKDEHGPRWRTCMLRLEMQGAYRPILIDGYEILHDKPPVGH